MVSSLAELGWEAECYYSGRGERRTITKQGGMGGGCDSKHCWLMELLLDPTTISLGSSTNFFLCQNISAGPRCFFLFLSCKAKLPRKHWTSTFCRRKISAINSSHHSSTSQVS